MTDRPKKRRGGRREPPGGAPKKGHVRLVCYVQPETRKAIDEEAERDGLTLGQVIDRWKETRHDSHIDSHDDKQPT